MPEVRPLINDGRRIEPAVSVNKITAGWNELLPIYNLPHDTVSFLKQKDIVI